MAEPLPILAFREQIVSAVSSNQVTVIRAETGAGKSTQVPQFLLDCGKKVTVTQPRRLAAIGIAERVAHELSCELGGIVGYRTANERMCSSDTRLLFCTDGLELVTELLGEKLSEGILVIDEVHEWNLNIETLIAWAHYQFACGAPYRVVIMSATIEPQPLVEYFGGGAIVEVPGRAFQVKEKPPRNSASAETLKLLNQGHNVLVFQPGKREIYEFISMLNESRVDAEVLPLHADMTYAEQALCFRSYRRPKCIVATNVAQTSITIPDIDAVVDSGLERRIEYVNGVEGLYIRPISLADRTQRKGRAGRVKIGTYLDFCDVPKEERAEYPQPDILCLPVDRVLLQLACAGVEIDELRFFHELPTEQVARAREMLLSLGCIDRWGTLTRIGKQVANLPVSTRWGRMLVEAENRNVLSQVIQLVSVMEQGRLTGSRAGKWKRKVKISSWSDAFVQIAAYNTAMNLLPFEFEENGIDLKAFVRARDLCHRLLTKFNVEDSWWEGSNRDIVCCIYAGLADCLFKRSLVRGYKDNKNDVRDLPPHSVVRDAEWVVGLPWNLQVQTELGPKTLRTITMATRVDPALFAEVVPHLALKDIKVTV